MPAHGRIPSVEVSAKQLPGDNCARQRILKRFGLDAQGNYTADENRTWIPKDSPEFPTWLDQQENIDERKMLKVVYEAVCEGKETGVSGAQLRTLPTELETLEKSVRKLMDAFYVIRTGVNTARFVGRPFVSPWLLHSFRTTRTSREASTDSEVHAPAEAKVICFFT